MDAKIADFGIHSRFLLKEDFYVIMCFCVRWSVNLVIIDDDDRLTGTLSNGLEIQVRNSYGG